MQNLKHYNLKKNIFTHLLSLSGNFTLITILFYMLASILTLNIWFLVLSFVFTSYFTISVFVFSLIIYFIQLFINKPIKDSFLLENPKYNKFWKQGNILFIIQFVVSTLAFYLLCKR